MKDERLSRLQQKILTLMYKFIKKRSCERVRNDDGSLTPWIYERYVYWELRKNLKIHKLTKKEIRKKLGISAAKFRLRLLRLSIVEKERLLNQWDDASLKASYSRSLMNLWKKKLILVGFTSEKPRKRVMAFSNKGYKVIRKKLLKKS